MLWPDICQKMGGLFRLITICHIPPSKGGGLPTNFFMDGPNCIEAQECRGDFWCKLEEAMRQAGGGYSIEKIAQMKLIDVVNTLAQNGIRMTYDQHWHIDTIMN